MASASGSNSGPSPNYVLGGVRVSLDLLQSLSSLISAPCAGPAITIASKVLTIIEVSKMVGGQLPSIRALNIHFSQGVQDNAEGVEKLKERVCSVTLVVATSLQGKDEKDVPKDMKENLEKLSK